MPRRPAMKLGISISFKNLDKLKIKEYQDKDVTAENVPKGYALIDTEIDITDEYEIEEDDDTYLYVDHYRLYLLKIKTASHGKIKYLLGYRLDGCDFITFFKDVLEWDGVVPECLKASRYGFKEPGKKEFRRETTKAEDDFVNRCFARVSNEEETLTEHFFKKVFTETLRDDIAEFLRPDGAR